MIRTSADRIPKGSKKPNKPDDKLGVALTTGVTFTGLGEKACADPLFLHTVPHLDDLTRPGVKFKNRPPGLGVTLPAGIFTVVEFYTEGAVWMLDYDFSVRPCVPRVTMIAAADVGPGIEPAVNFNNGPPVPLVGDAWVLITNLEPTKANTHDAPGVHWKKYHTVTDGTPDDIATYEKLPEFFGLTRCKKKPTEGKFTARVLDILGHYRTVDSSECTNSHWP